VSDIESLTRALNEKVQHHLDAHPDCDGYVQSSERKNALYDRDRRENDLPPLPPSRTEDVPLTDKRWTDRTFAQHEEEK
jgi:hypothetical protein